MRQSPTYTNGYQQYFLYTGKEFIADLDMIDFGARMFDPALGRWFVPDESQASYSSVSPYSYGYNNPINLVDFDGNDLADDFAGFLGNTLGRVPEVAKGADRLADYIRSSDFLLGVLVVTVTVIDPEAAAVAALFVLCSRPSQDIHDVIFTAFVGAAFGEAFSAFADFSTAIAEVDGSIAAEEGATLQAEELSAMETSQEAGMINVKDYISKRFNLNKEFKMLESKYGFTIAEQGEALPDMAYSENGFIYVREGGGVAETNAITVRGAVINRQTGGSTSRLYLSQNALKQGENRLFVTLRHEFQHARDYGTGAWRNMTMVEIEIRGYTEGINAAREIGYKYTLPERYQQYFPNQK